MAENIFYSDIVNEGQIQQALSITLTAIDRATAAFKEVGNTLQKLAAGARSMSNYYKKVQKQQIRAKRAQRLRYLQRREYFNNVKLSAWLYWRHNNEAPICVTDIARRRPMLRVYDRISKQRGRTMWQLKTVITV